MAIGLENFPNIIPADSDYLKGRIKDNPGDGSGTPINQYTNGDIQEFFAKLMGLQSITPNGLPDNEYSGHQYIETLWKFGNLNFVKDMIIGLLGSYTANDLIVLYGCQVTANVPGTSSIAAGAIYYNGNIYKVAAQPSISSPANTLVFKIDSSVDPFIIYLANDAVGSGIADWNQGSVKAFSIPSSVADGRDVTKATTATSNGDSLDTTLSSGAPYDIDNIIYRYDYTLYKKSCNLSFSVTFDVTDGANVNEIRIPLPAGIVKDTAYRFFGSGFYIATAGSPTTIRCSLEIRSYKDGTEGQRLVLRRTEAVDIVSDTGISVLIEGSINFITT